YYNSMLSFGSAPTQTYRKSHLVPFGEFIPLKGFIGWIYRDWLQMPLSDLSRGSATQKPLAIAGQHIAVNICYEDAFGEEIIRQLPEATLLINASNMAWYGSSWSADQHMQMSQMRALETGRMMLRATNTGATAIIDSGGNIVAHAPHFSETILEGKAQGYAGSTPYVRFGNWPVIILCFGLLGLLWVRKKK
ncbi:MAG TPA: apolipoprotein N-acyltransferase, partial [Methylophilaceae bacterium]|nr:apolipoprotein N-acyltransferase [Methylophilaceae bacterium]